MNITDGFGAVVAWIVAFGALLAALGVIGAAIGRAWRRAIGTKANPGWVRRLIRLVDDLRDVPEQVAALTATVSTNSAALAVIQKELHPNGGSSLRDAADRIESKVGTLIEGTTP